MVDRPQIKFFIVFLTVLVSLSVMSVSALALLTLNATVITNAGITYGDTGFGVNVSNRTAYEANRSYAFSVNVSNVSSVNAQFHSINLTLCYITGNSCRNFTFSYNGTGGMATSNFTKITAAGVYNASSDATTRLQNVSYVTVNFTQAQLGPAGNYNITWSAGVNTTIADYNVSTTEVFNISVAAVNLTLKANNTDGNHTIKFVGTSGVQFKASFNSSNTNSTGEQLFIQLDTNITGWVVSVAARTNMTNITLINETVLARLSNRLYNITASWPGNENITAQAVTIFLTVGPAGGATLTLNATAVSEQGLNNPAGNMTFGLNVSNRTAYEANRSYSFGVNITNGTDAIASNVTFTLCYITGNSCRNFTASINGSNANGLGNIATSNLTKVQSWGAINQTVGDSKNITRVTINFTQSQLGPTGNYNFTWSAWINDSIQDYGFGFSNTSSTEVFNISKAGLNITLRVNGTAGSRTCGDSFTCSAAASNPYNFDDNAAILNISAVFNTSVINSSSDKIYIEIFTNISGWVVATANLTNDVITGFNQSTLPKIANTTYNITAYYSGNENISAVSITVHAAARDNQRPSITISKPVAKSAFTENSMILNFGVGDNSVDANTCDYKVDSGSFKSATASKDISIIDLSAGDHTILVRCDDASSNREENTVKFSVNLIGTPGGVPSAASAPIVSTPSEDKAKVYIPKVAANKETVVPIDKGDVTAVSLLVNSPVNSIYIDVNRLDAKPADISDAPGKVFRYLEIKAPVLTANVLDKAKIKFKVAKSWIAENSADATKIYLNRFADGTWNRLGTTKDSEDANSIVYLAESPGFSTFAISYEEAAPSQPTPAPAPTPTPAPAPTPSPTPTPPAAIPRGTVPDLKIIGIVVVIAIIVVVLLKITSGGRKIFKYNYQKKTNII